MMRGAEIWKHLVRLAINHLRQSRSSQPLLAWMKRKTSQIKLYPRQEYRTQRFRMLRHESILVGWNSQ